MQEKPKKEKRRIVFDIDGVIANPYDEHNRWLDYRFREPYPFVRDFLLELQQDFIIILQTARYMGRHKGDTLKAYSDGYKELAQWLNVWEIPYDGLYMGKASGDFYVDDKAIQVQSSKGEADWFALLREVRSA